VTELAGICGVSNRTLERYFQEAYQQTPKHWLAELRWRQSLELVREGASVKAIATELGYQQASTFSREFKKRFGQCPAIFARMFVNQNKMSHKGM
jgi:transcriptional regulator GlxA family with amidase domain